MRSLRKVIRARHFTAVTALALASATLGSTGCFGIGDDPQPRTALFVGVDVSGSFLKGKHFEDSMDFMANYLYAHLRGLGGLDIPKHLFVGSIGGLTFNDAKTFYPIETFQDKSVAQIRTTLAELFPKDKVNRLTDFNAFFKQVAALAVNKNLILKPIVVVLISDGVPDAGKNSTRTIVVKELEKLSRNVTIRLLYTDANTGNGWQNRIRRTRARIWTQDADVMVHWRDATLFEPSQPLETQTKLLDWIKDNVDFGVKAKRVD